MSISQAICKRLLSEISISALYFRKDGEMKPELNREYKRSCFRQDLLIHRILPVIALHKIAARHSKQTIEAMCTIPFLGKPQRLSSMF